jgi:SRSO17 transposase
MPNLINAAAERRLQDYFDRIGSVLGHKTRRESFAVYAMGILGEGERKSIEPIACRGCPDAKEADAAHQRLLHFALDSPLGLTRFFGHQLRGRYGVQDGEAEARS